jgi:hypothetical protein
MSEPNKKETHMPRITVRLPPDLHSQPLLFARGRNREQPEVSAIVREALEAYLGQRPTPRRTPTPKKK